MKKIITGLFTLLIGAYLIAWYIAATHLKTEVEGALSSVQHVPGVHVKYDQVSLNGFPFKLGTTIKGLSVWGKTGNLFRLASVDAKKHYTPEQLNTFYTLENKLTFSQNLVYSINPFSRTINLTTNNIDFESKDVNNDVIIRATGQTHYDIAFDKFHLTALFSSGKNSLIDVRDVKGFRFQSGPSKIIDVHNSTTLISAKSSMLSWQRSQAMNHKLNHFRFQYQVNDSNTSEHFLEPFLQIAFYQALYNDLSSKPSIPHGKGQIDIDIAATLPNIPLLPEMDGAALFKKHKPQFAFNEKFLEGLKENTLQFSINQFLISNSRGNTDFKAKFVQKPLVNNHFQFTTSIHGKMTTNQEFIDTIKQKVLTELKPSLERKGIKILDQQQYQAAANNLVPRLDQWGETTFDTENTMVWSANNKKDYQLKLEQFELNTQPFQIKLTGDAQDDGQNNQQIALQLLLHNYQDIIHRAHYTGTQFVALLNATNTSLTSEMKFTADSEQQVIKLLQQIGGINNPSVTDITIDIKLDKDGSFNIGAMPMVQVLQQLQNLSLVKEISLTTKQKIAKITKSADNGDVHSQLALGLLFDSNALGKPDYTQSAKWYKRASEQNNAMAYNNLGVLHANGWGVEQNKSLAENYFKKAIQITPEMSKYCDSNINSLNKQKHNPALISFTSNGLLITCKQYDQQAINNLFAVNNELGFKSIHLIEPGKLHSIPKQLRAYALKKGAELGVKVTQ